MLHGISFIKVDNSKIQSAIASNAPKDTISWLKQEVSWAAVYGFEYAEVPFTDLRNILTNDYGFSPFKYKSVEEGAIYNKEKHPNAYGRVRGRDNISKTISWVCLDVDDTAITDQEMHKILHKVNHHIARTSDINNPYKYRILLELKEVTEVNTNIWKFFIKSIADSLFIKVDNLGASQCFYGYDNREVYSTIDQTTLDPSTHLKKAYMLYSVLEEKRANAIPKGEADKALLQPYSTFGFAYEALPGEGTNKLLAAVHLAKSLGASADYTKSLVYSINNFWDSPMPINRLQSTVLTAI